jgi:hypothetical protein
MVVLNAILFLLVLFGLICLPFLIWLLVRPAFGWGFRDYPKLTALIVALLILGLFAAALSFHHFFPECWVGIRRVLCLPARLP